MNKTSNRCPPNKKILLSIIGASECSTCRQVKPIGEFNNSKASKIGVSNRCKECNRDYMSKWRENNPNAFKDWYKGNKGERAEYWRYWYKENRGRRSESYKAWARKNKHVINSIIARRTAAKKNATPAWADEEKIREIYKQASYITEETGIKHEVDHIYPLQGDHVCGLHCEHNLQILTKQQNIRKSNKMPGELYEDQ